MKFTYAPESKPLEGFTIKRAIHRGGFGEVYYALTDAGKEVALKLLHTHSEIELRGATQCLNLNHPNLVTIYDIRMDGDGDSWVIMEYVGGKRLADLLEERSKLPVEEIERWLDGLTAGLGFLHERGIVHRDLKPANIYSENGIVKIGDVGLSKFITENRHSAHTQSVGTVHYMAPEVARGRYGREVDVYALGIMLFEMLTGDVPFDGESTGEILMKHLSERPLLTAVPERLRPVIARALEKDPARRTPSVTALRDEFKAAVRGKTLPNESHTASYSAARTTAGYSEGAYTVPVHSMPAPAAGRRNESQWVQSQERLDEERQKHRNRWIVAGIIFVLFLHLLGGRQIMPSLMELAILAALGYGGYRAARWMWNAVPTPAPAPVVTPPPPVSQPPRSQARSRPLPLVVGGPVPRAMSARKRIRELTGSMVASAIAVGLLSMALVPTDLLAGWPDVALFASTGIIAVWTLLGIGKLFEGTQYDSLSRRLTQGLAGAGVGLAAYGLQEFLMAHPLQRGTTHAMINHVGDVRLVAESGRLEPLAFVLFFSGLFLFRRWWIFTEAWRNKRLQISSVLLTTLLGYVVTAFVAFPHSWGLLWATVMASAIQVAAVWTPWELRSQEAGTPVDRQAA